MRLNSFHIVAPTVLCLALSACADRSPTDTGPGPLPDPRNFTTEELQVASANTDFGFELLRHVLPHSDEPNLLLSPLSASMALGMAMNGAAGETYDAMRATLGFGTMSETDIKAAYRGLIDQLRARDPGVEFRLANSVWARMGFDFQQAFLDDAGKYFDAEVRELDFQDPGSPAVINAWVNDITGGRIESIIDEIDPLDIMFLLNAVYFKAPWSDPFEPEATRPATFHLLDGGTVEAPTMVRDGQTSWHSDADATIVDLPYADGTFSMTLLQPAENRTLEQLVESLSSQQWESWLESLETSRVMLYLPRFRFQFDTGLRDALDHMGMTPAFKPHSADFSRLTTVRDDVYISAVRQKSFIDVHELGTEAAAVTAVTIGVTSMPPVIRFDGPFLFAIREAESGAILFMGLVGDPTAD